jgi:hypothetical protein
VRDGRSVAAHGCWGAIEDGGLTWVFPGDGPVPVWLGATVPAFFPEGFLIDIQKITVEVEEETLEQS